MNKWIIYDADCRFCIRFANWCKKNKPDFVLLPVRDKQARDLLRRKGIQFINLQTIYFIDGLEVMIRSKAIFGICHLLHYPWKLIAFCKYLPPWFTDYFYTLFAKYRYYFN